MADLAIDVRDLTKTYRTPFTRKRVEALRGVTFGVERGHIFGFVGPNGAGKTTTIRTLMGLVRPTGGTASLLGHPLASRAARARIGFLPEAPYFYDYLTVAELCDLAGRLFGLAPATRKRRADELIAKVGLDRARGQSLKKFSKGMLQRAGLAQALMNDPELVVLDEPMSGLDPIGRKEVRDLILELRDHGKTVFFSTHILSDIEAITDRVAIIARGQLQAHGTPAELVSRSLLGVEITVRMPAPTSAPSPASTDTGAVASDGDAALTEGATRVRRTGDELTVTLAADADVDAWIARAHAAGGKILQVAPRHETLEDLFVRQVASADTRAAS
ncbi:MAG TPA: ABC transporter ATP-binding protein [Kofleriaceae bacterium]|nr:ABC transporter ATP-binding protein [Kofleriaceae bacterium]